VGETVKDLTKPVDLYSNYGDFTEPILDAIRKETFGVDIGQNSWITVDEYDRFISWLRITSDHHVLEVASGSGGPALYLAQQTGCRVTGIDANELGVATGSQLAERAGQTHNVRFQIADATAPLPFEENTFDGLLCIDAMNHLPERVAVLREWRRVLRPGARAIFTDPVVISGLVTNEELALRGSIGLFVFAPSSLNEQLIDKAGLRLIQRQDVSENAALVARRWHTARHNHKQELIKLEGEERFEGLQRFFEAVHRLTSERRLTRIVYLVEK
jgi:SAM-dependent methyltransferase